MLHWMLFFSLQQLVDPREFHCWIQVSLVVTFMSSKSQWTLIVGVSQTHKMYYLSITAKYQESHGECGPDTAIPCPFSVLKPWEH